MAYKWRYDEFLGVRRHACLDANRIVAFVFQRESEEGWYIRALKKRNRYDTVMDKDKNDDARAEAGLPMDAPLGRLRVQFAIYESDVELCKRLALIAYETKVFELSKTEG